MELSLPNQLGEFPVGGQKLKLVGNTLGLVPDGNTVDLSTLVVQPNITPQAVPPTPDPTTNTFGNLRPVFWDTTTSKLVMPTTALIRLFRVTTPSATGNQVTITDLAGNPYPCATWTCVVAGFGNTGSDRTYQAYTIPTLGGNWKVEYDQAGGAGSVWILAISNQLMANVSF
jgi:hypothetical protein